MTDLHARIDLLEGELPSALGGAASAVGRRLFSILSLTRGDGTAGVGEASPLPGYSPDSIDEVVEELHRLAGGPVIADPLGSPWSVVSEVFSTHPVQCPSSRFAIETALLDWLGHVHEQPLHRVLAGDAERRPIPIADLVLASNAAEWPTVVDRLVSDGATHVKFKIASDLEREIAALTEIRRAHPHVHLRLDGNRRVPLEQLRRHGAALEALELELFEEPVSPDAWESALTLRLPFALDETLRDRELSERLLQTGRISAVVLKPMVLGGFCASFDAAERAAACGAGHVVSHTFDGPIARAATAELALALQSTRAAGLGWHPALALWNPHAIAAIDGRMITPHGSPGLGLHFEDTPNA